MITYMYVIHNILKDKLKQSIFINIIENQNVQTLKPKPCMTKKNINTPYNYTSHKNNCQKIQPAHFIVTKRVFILRGNCFYEKYILLCITDMTLHRHWVRTANITASLKRAREKTLSEHGFVPPRDFKTCQSREITKTRISTSMGL